MNRRADPPRSSRRGRAAAHAWCLAPLAALATAAAAQTAPAARVVPLAARAPAQAAISLPGATASNTPCDRIETGPLVQVSVGKSTVIRPATPMKRVLLGNPVNAYAGTPRTQTDKAGKGDKGDKGDKADKNDRADPAGAKPGSNDLRPGVADVDIVLLGPTEVYVLGKGIGSTNVVLQSQGGSCMAFDVVVGFDTGALQALIGQLLPGEKNVRVTAAYDSIVLTGAVTDAAAAARVVDLANAFVRTDTGAAVTGANPRVVNMLSTSAPQQVMLEVKVAEVSKALLDQFGINFARAYVSGDGLMMRFLSGLFGGGIASFGQISSTGPNGVPLSSVDTVVGGTINGSTTNGTTTGGLIGGNVTTSVDSSGRVVYTTTYGTVPGRGVTSGTLNMQRNDGMVKVLAEPNIMAISGQEGRFNAGGKIFIPVAQANTGGGTVVTLEEKEFGVSVRFRPTVLEGGRINMDLATEVSELNPTGVGISAPGVSGLAVLPAFTSRKASTMVQLSDGQSFAIGGLIKNNSTASVKAFPILGEMPVIGALFRSTEFQSDKSELVFVVTPRLVKPLPPNFTLPTDNYREPSRNDLILHGRIEAPPPAPGAAPVPAPSAQAEPAAPAAPAVAAGGFQVR